MTIHFLTNHDIKSTKPRLAYLAGFSDLSEIFAILHFPIFTVALGPETTF